MSEHPDYRFDCPILKAALLIAFGAEAQHHMTDGEANCSTICAWWTGAPDTPWYSGCAIAHLGEVAKHIKDPDCGLVAQLRDAR